MKHTAKSDFGRTVAAAQMVPDQIEVVDKWEILAELTIAAEARGINHRTLGVLKALMTFLPSRIINPNHLGAIVFPSNKTLSNRLNGMPDSTLRRHLASLVHAGIVSRHESANRKRFARRIGQSVKIAFGFDLSPMARQAQQIKQDAKDAQTALDALMALRSEVAGLRQCLIQQNGTSTYTDAIARVLRRKPDAAELARIRDELTKKMSTVDDQNERHIQNEFIPKSDSVEREVSEKKPDTLLAVVETCQEYKSYFPEPVHNWHELIGIADRLSTMIGIDPFVFKEAMQRIGIRQAATAVLCILENLNNVQNPGGYLRRICQNAGQGGFSTERMLKWARNGGNCQLTI